MANINRTEFGDKASELLRGVYNSIMPLLSQKFNRKFDHKINYAQCTVEILDDDHSTVWVKWGNKYDCKLDDLPVTALGTIADSIVRYEEDFGQH